MDRFVVTDIVVECACYLVHPNLWIRQATAGFVAAASKALGVVYVQVRVIKHLKPYMQRTTMHLEKYDLFFELLLGFK